MEVSASSKFKTEFSHCHVVGSKGQEKTAYPNEFTSSKFRIIAVMSANSRLPKRNA